MITPAQGSLKEIMLARRSIRAGVTWIRNPIIPFDSKLTGKLSNDIRRKKCTKHKSENQSRITE